MAFKDLVRLVPAVPTWRRSSRIGMGGARGVSGVEPETGAKRSPGQPGPRRAVAPGGGGTIDMSRISAFALTAYGGDKSSLLSIPYTFAGRDHFWNFAGSDLASEFLLEPVELDLGIRGLFCAEEGQAFLRLQAPEQHRMTW